MSFSVECLWQTTVTLRLLSFLIVDVKQHWFEWHWNPRNSWNYFYFQTFSGAHYPERATSLFSCNDVFTSRVIFRYAFPAKFTVSGYVRIEIWVKTMVAKLRCLCYCIPISTCCFPSFQPSFLKLVFPQSHAFYVHFPHVQVKQRHTFDTFLSVRVLSIECTLCKFFSLLCNGQEDF